MMYIYPSYEKTIECLKEVGFKTYTADELAEHVTRINNVTDKETIKEILPYIYEDYVLKRPEILYAKAKDISVSVYTKDSKDVDDRYEARLFYNYTDLPDNVKKYF
ncbi:MAG: hypothetical protein LUD77_11340 [Clostridiales bacterium]|nr:hypothetical protein [Clostridiales bacterium]